MHPFWGGYALLFFSVDKLKHKMITVCPITHQVSPRSQNRTQSAIVLPLGNYQILFILKKQKKGKYIQHNQILNHISANSVIKGWWSIAYFSPCSTELFSVFALFVLLIILTASSLENDQSNPIYIIHLMCLSLSIKSVRSDSLPDSLQFYTGVTELKSILSGWDFTAFQWKAAFTCPK